MRHQRIFPLYRLRLIALLTVVCFCSMCPPAHAELKVGDLCRVKGQEENVLQGLGLVVGLKGTGDGDAQPTTRALAQMLTLMGNPITSDPLGNRQLRELKNAKNVALVFVTVVVPAAGARQGDRLKCQVSAVSAKSLDGGYLMTTPLLGPTPAASPADRAVFAFAHGLLHLPDLARPTTAVIEKGSLLEADFFNPFIASDHTITLVMQGGHAGFRTTHEIAEQIRQEEDFRDTNDRPESVALALDAVNVRVKIPRKYHTDPVVFVQAVLDQRLLPPRNASRVVINERTGVIVLDANIEIGPVLVTHKNLTIQTGAQTGADQGAVFAPVDSARGRTTEMKSLLDALNTLRVPSQDVIEIIKEIHRSGKLYGHLVVEK